MYLQIKWPPEFDAIKIQEKIIFARVKDTDIWIELDPELPDWLDYLESTEMKETVLAWVRKC